ncbi:MAG: DUF434 domain-containing protein [Deltaproteobacteria bacterium]|nr:DUF434 domain-containing protein [Deltaproteobacteria bacterium]MBW1952839.1 DUF434 domain-containing protein [Deltaproteobacteria bacterium]MBW1986769.1 DUF434 domain-containing protein [Deltaproteobacteria bacterium]MBW2135273.1 DUF434 domain-containing protein [Deltaproteobacteria bacterium]
MILEDLETPQLQEAARDYRYLLTRGYPRQAALNLVGNRYQQSYTARQLLHRGVFDPPTAARRRAKLATLAVLGAGPLGLDGHNVLITLECGLRGLPLVAADDGFIRDVGEISRSYRPSATTDHALNLLAQYLREHRVGPVKVWYDAPLSRSGELAARTRQLFRDHGLAGDAQAVAVPEKALIAEPIPVGTSDTALIDQVAVVVDVAGEILRPRPGIRIISFN